MLVELPGREIESRPVQIPFHFSFQFQLAVSAFNITIVKSDVQFQIPGSCDNRMAQGMGVTPPWAQRESSAGLYAQSTGGLQDEIEGVLLLLWIWIDSFIKMYYSISFWSIYFDGEGRGRGGGECLDGSYPRWKGAGIVPWPPDCEAPALPLGQADTQGCKGFQWFMNWWIWNTCLMLKLHFYWSFDDWE